MDNQNSKNVQVLKSQGYQTFINIFCGDVMVSPTGEDVPTEQVCVMACFDQEKNVVFAVVNNQVVEARSAGPLVNTTVGRGSAHSPKTTCCHVKRLKYWTDKCPALQIMTVPEFRSAVIKMCESRVKLVKFVS